MALTKPLARTIVPSLDPAGRTASSYQDHATASTEASTALAQAPGFGTSETVTIDATGKLTPTVSRDILIETFGAAASDFLDAVSLAALPEGMTAVLSLASAARKVVLRHAMTSSDPDAGTLLLADGVNAGDQLILDSTSKSVTIQRRGIGIYERSRSGFFSSGSTIGQASQDFGGYAVTGMGLGYKPVADTDRTFIPGDRGWIVQFTSSATARVPDPNDQTDPDPTNWVRPGQVHLWECRGASLLFRRWDGAAPANPSGHDRALGTYAQGWVIASPNPSTGNLEWVLTGVTQGPPTGGTTQRTVFWSSLTGADLTLASTDTATHTAATLNHAFGASEKWVYLARFGFFGAGAGSTSLTRAWSVMQGTPDVEMAHTQRPGYATSKGSYCLLWGNTFGGTAGSQTVRLDAANGQTGSQVVVNAPIILALRLETDESYVTDAGPHSESAGTFAAAATLTYTSLPSDEYEILFGAEWSTSAGQACDFQISVNGTIESVIVTQRAAGRPAWYSGITPFTLSGSGSIILQFRRDTAATGTVTVINSTIVLLRAGRFQAAASSKSAAASSYTSSTMTSKINRSVSLQSAWYSLIIGGAQTLAPSASGSILCNGQLTQSNAPVGPTWANEVNAAGQWSPTSTLTFGVVQPIANTDVLDMSFASADGSSQVQAEGASFVALALKPA